MKRSERESDICKLNGSVTLTAVCLFFFACLLFLQQIVIHPVDQDFEDYLWDEDYYESLMENHTVAESNETCLLVYDPDDDESVLVCDTVSYVLESMNITVRKTEIHTSVADESEDSSIEQEENDIPVTEEIERYKENVFEINDDISSLLICTNNLASLNAMAVSVRDWVTDGGHLLMASGLYADMDIFQIQTEEFSLWCSLLGIMESKGVSECEIRSLKFTSDLLTGAEGMEFSDDVVSGSMLGCILENACEIHAIDPENEDNPVIWSLDQGDGRVAVCNADLMDSKSDRGVIASLYCDLYPAFVYPVINAAVYCIDDFPAPVPAGYEANVLAQYGYTVSDFIADTWLPAMLDLSEKYDIPYSVFIVQTYDDNVEGPFDDTTNQTDAILYASEILNHGGEIGIHGYNHQPLTLSGFVFDSENEGYTSWNSIGDMMESVRAVLDYGKSIVADATIQSYVAPSNVISEEALEEMLVQMEDLRVYAGVYIGTEDQLVQEYSVLENGVVYFPRLTADMQMEDSEWWLQINELSYHYVECNFIHPDDILDEERSDGGDFSQMLAGYEEMLSWNTQMGLRACTISQGAAAVQRYSGISVHQTLSDEGMEIQVSGLVDEAYLMLRTDGRIPCAVSGASIEQIDESTWILCLTQEEIEITWE